MNTTWLGAACMATFFTACSTTMDMKPTKNGPFVTATYDVPVERQEEFLIALIAAEDAMREAGLITAWPAVRMRSRAEPSLLLEVFQWCDDASFEEAQRTPAGREQGGLRETLWTSGGFGVERFPEAQEPWAQFAPLH